MRKKLFSRLALLLLVMLLNGALLAQFTPSNSPSVEFNWQSTERAKDFLFVGIMRQFNPSPRRPTHMLFDAQGDLVWYLQGNDWIYDFKMQEGGRMSLSDNSAWRVMDSTFTVVDSFRCIGYNTDIHDFILKPNNHAFLICLEDTIADLSALTSPNGTVGNQNGRLDGIVIQEQDENHQVVKNWHSWDHYGILDADTVFFTNPNRLDLNHTNSIDVDDNGNLLLSHRNISEVTLLDWATGDIKYRLGGTNNQFDLQGDPGTSAQHDAKLLPNNRVSVFDNGTNRHASRGLVYALDTVNMIATIEKEYEIPTALSAGMGSFQYLDDGTAVMGLGNMGTSTLPRIYYYDANGSEVLNVDFQSTYESYRAQIGELPYALDRPNIQCEIENGNIVLGLADVYSDYLWTTDETSAEITVVDTGYYQVFVPQGIGMIASNKVYVSDLSQACSTIVGTPELMEGPKKPIRLIGRFDILGRPVAQPIKGQLIIERYSNGSQRKLIYVE